MKVGSLVILLSDVEALAEALGNSAARQDLEEFRKLLAGHENSTVAQFAGKLAKGKESAGTSASQPILRLQHILLKLQALLVSAGGNAAAKDVEQLIGLLQDCGHASVAQFVEQARGWVAKPAANRAKSAKAKTAIDKIAPAELVRRYSNDLAAASTDNAAFDQLVLRLDADRGVRKQDMREIAKNYLGYEIAKKKGRSDALQDIVDRQALNARQEARGQSHSRMKPW